jgi:3-hydroxybutyryl-CoA dehydrogenase
MTLAVWATDDQWNEISACSNAVQWRRMNSASDIEQSDTAFFMLASYQAKEWPVSTKPIFVHAVIDTLQAMKHTQTTIRINAWPGFLQRSNWEIAGILTDSVVDIFALLHKQYTLVPDVPGFVAPRIIAMIINEAYFALGEGISTKEEIDIAMKLGTNYPFGPFEWAAKIGIKNIFSILHILSAADKRYLPAPLLEAATA